MVYEPREDSWLLEAAARRIVEEGMDVLDMGCGSGIQSFAACERGARVVAVDVDPRACEQVREGAKARGFDIVVVESDLFDSVDGVFDIILFNAPYLPRDDRDRDVALDGGVEGHEVIARFLSTAREYLREGGSVLLLFSTRTGFERVLSCIGDNGFRAEEVAMQPLFFERLFVYRLRV